MNGDKDREFVKQLVESTEQGRVAWEPTATLDEFTTNFKGKYSVIVSKVSDRDYRLRMVDDGEGREMLRLEYEEDEDPYGQGHGYYEIHRLFEAARRAGLHVEEAIDDILQDLKH
jgi:hypothetical protein